MVADAGFQIHPRYRKDRPLDATLALVQPGLDDFITEKYADLIDKILAEWSSSLLKSSQDTARFTATMADDFTGTSLEPVESKVTRSDSVLEIRRNKFTNKLELSRDAFARELQSSFMEFSKIVTAEFQITGMEVNSSSGTRSAGLPSLTTQIRYEITGAGHDFFREQRVGNCKLDWQGGASGTFQLLRWQSLEETRARSRSPVFVDIASTALGGNVSYSAQLMHGSDYWRTLLDGACGIDVYGHNGISVADIDNDGYDDLYVCQPAGLPNRLYRNRRDGTFGDITESSGLGLLENTACAIFADFGNSGRQDVIVVRASGPSLFLNEGGGKFRERAGAFQFANAPQGTFTGAAVADYDRDGWLDIYFCTYSYYQGTGQYHYPLPYHDAENGPPNFLMRNQRDGTFRDVTVASGLGQNNTRYSFCCAWSDFNRDGWPDLYVVNDFGRKNLYRNNGNGTFTDVATQEGVEDVGAGMSVSWADYDNGGVEDLYVANMWTAAGERISTQPNFKKDSPPGIRALYQKHAMGNSLYRNRDARFTDATQSSGTGVGRWSWSSDTIDFDHDGFSDLYITNGMVSGPSRTDLNSFFWRQVVGSSPDDARPSSQYEQGWNAINELLRSDCSWSGYERNIFYANNGDRTFSDVSAAIGLDFVEDGRAFAVADFDHDGRLELFLKNRNAPQVRLLKNLVENLPPSISFKLQGAKSNRDAIGAVVTVKSGANTQTRTLRAGSGFLSQHSKDVFFGLGNSTGAINASIRWPSGAVQELHDLPANHRVWVQEGSDPSRIEPLRPQTGKAPVGTAPSTADVDPIPERIETWLLAPVSALDFSLPDLSGKTQALSDLKGKVILLTFWSVRSKDCLRQIEALQKIHGSGKNQTRQLLTVNLDTVTPNPISGEGAQESTVRALIRDRRLSIPILLASEDVIAIYNLLYRQLFDRHRDLTLPASFLIDDAGIIVKVYQGVIDPQHFESDFGRIPINDSERLARALPFSGTGAKLEFVRNYLSTGAMFFQRGYLDQAEIAFQQGLRNNPQSAEALYGIGSVYLNQQKNSAASEAFERVVKMHANYPDTLPEAWNNLGVIATRESRVADSVECFQQALRLNPQHLLALDNLGNAYRLQKRWDEAKTVLERALEVAPQDPEANYSLAMVYAQAGDTDKAYQFLQRALQARPVYPEALNNLGILYLRTNRRDDAVRSFEQCIRVAPAFDQSYLNLAQVYALEGSRDKARQVLTDLLKLHPDHARGKQMLGELQE